jgi:hypothetical protein
LGCPVIRDTVFLRLSEGVSPGNHFSDFSIKGIRCGALICHDYRYPELYREYKRRGVQLMFHSYHAGGILPPRLAAMREDVGEDFWGLNPGSTIPEIAMPATMISGADNNHVWISRRFTGQAHEAKLAPIGTEPVPYKEGVTQGVTWPKEAL